jgi:hypothetical protein
MAVPRFFTNHRDTRSTETTSPARDSTAAMTTWMAYSIASEETRE